MSVERQFDAAMIDIYKRALKECGYRATRFLQMVTEQGGLKTARTLLAREETSDGFAALWELGRHDLTMEYLVLQPQYAELFSPDELATAQQRLQALGWGERAGG